MISHLNKEDAAEIGIYSIINDHTGETYCGSGILGKCLSRHYRGYVTGNHDNANLREAFQRTPQGWNFYPVVINEPGLTREENRQVAFDLEQNDIDTCKGDPLFLNISVNARKCRPIGIKHSEETKEKMSQAHQERLNNLSEEDKKKIAEIGKKNLSGYNAAIKERGVPEEVRKKQSDARLKLFENGYISPLAGTHLTDERKDQMSEVGRAIWQSLPEEIQKERIENLKSHLPGNKFTLGRKQPPEEIERRRQANTGKIRDEEGRNNIRNAIVQRLGVGVVIEGQTFDTYSDAARACGVNVQTVINRVNSNSDKFVNWKLK